jgi:hypothetical protein
LGQSARCNAFLTTIGETQLVKIVRRERRRAPRPDDPELRGRRSERRARVLLEATAEAIAGHAQVTLLEVSANGARLEGHGLPGLGKEIILRCGSVETFGTIVWSEGDCRGLRFDEKLTPPDLITIRAHAAAVQHSRLSPEERQGAADWLNGLAR